MQRIGENTFIDDTLVTCAEYQLFIDEMREQGKYYQPDHWTSYQFPKGQAKEPILGVRYSDAIAFCEWINKQRGGKYKFRLPSSIEAASFPIHLISKNPSGYWVQEYQIVWNGKIPEFSLSFIQELSSEFLDIQDIVQSQDVSASTMFDRGAKQIQVSELIKLINDISNNTNIVPDKIITPDKHFRLTLLSKILSIYSKTINNSTINKLRANTPNHLVSIPGHDENIPIFSDQHKEVSEITDDLYIGLLVLKERILGLFPAFEGIRLVRYDTEAYHSKLHNELGQLFPLINKMFDVDVMLSWNKDIPQLSETIERDLYLLIREVIIHAIRHGNSKIIKIKGSMLEHLVNISILFNGEVFSLEQITRVGAIASKVKIMKGVLKVSSYSGGVTRISISIPTSNT